MVILQIQTQLSEQTVHLLCMYDNNKPMKIPFRIFQAVLMFSASHTVHYIHSGALMRPLQQRNCPQHKIPTRPKGRSEYSVFGEKAYKRCVLKSFTPAKPLFVCFLWWMFNWYLILNPITQTRYIFAHVMLLKIWPLTSYESIKRWDYWSSNLISL